MDLVEIAKVHPALEKLLGGGLAARGTTDQGIKRMARGEMPIRRTGTLGPGVYTTNTLREAAEYREAVPGARIAVFRPQGEPRRTMRSSTWNEDVWRPEDLGKPIHVQNSNRTTAMRLRRQELGMPREDHRLKPMVPVSQLTPKQRETRMYQAKYRRKYRGVEGFELPPGDRPPWQRQ